MSAHVGGAGEGFCDACGRRYTWGCGHTEDHEREAREHEQAEEHRTGACWHFDHSECDPSTCERAGVSVAGYAAFVHHANAEQWIAEHR